MLQQAKLQLRTSKCKLFFRRKSNDVLTDSIQHVCDTVNSANRLNSTNYTNTVNYANRVKSANRKNSANKVKSEKRVNEKKIRVRKRKRKSKTSKHSSLSIFSCNAANIKNKLLSLEKIVNDLNISIFCLQETHEAKIGAIKFQTSENYQIYEKIRTNKGGGGLAVGILKDLNPSWIRDGGGEVEALTIKFKVKHFD